MDKEKQAKQAKEDQRAMWEIVDNLTDNGVLHAFQIPSFTMGYSIAMLKCEKRHEKETPELDTNAY